MIFAKCRNPAISGCKGSDHPESLERGVLGSAAAQRHVVLVPIADMPNHARPKNAAWRYSEDDGFVIETESDIPAGGEVLHSYGSRSNQALLVEYGFAGPPSPLDVVPKI